MATKPTLFIGYKSTRTQNPETVLDVSTVNRVDWTLGRNNITDQYSGGTCRIYGRDISKISGLVIGYEVVVSMTDQSVGGTSAQFYGYISDIRRIYGTTAAYDTWEVLVEGPYSRAARAFGTITTTAGASTNAMAESLVTAGATDTGTNFANYGGWGSTTSAQTYTGQYSDVIDVLMATDQATMLEGYVGIVTQFSPIILTIWSPAVMMFGRNTASSSGVAYNLADDGTTYSSVAPVKFTEIEFLSAAQNYSTKVTVQASGLADQSSGTGTYAITIPTINSTTTEAANVAGYVKTSLDLSSSLPYTISFNGTGTTSSAAFYAKYNAIGNYLRIKFRGTEYFAIIQGLEMTATPSNWECRYYLSSNLQNAWLKLDNTVQGTLDNNRLGF